jgi:uncharacterized protein (TIGR03083 family)
VDSDRVAIRRAIDALDETLHATVDLCRSLTPGEWRRPTACPGWTVHDQVAHLAGVEARLAGRPPLDARPLPPLAHVTSDTDREVEADVHARRRVPDHELLDELAEVVDAHLALLRTAPPDPADRLPFLGGRLLPARVALSIRVLDAWTHGEDIRLAVGAPADDASLAAGVTAEQFLRGFAGVVERAAPGSSALVLLELTGPFAATEVVALDTEPTASPTVRLTMSLTTFCRRSAGRIDAPAAEATSTVHGDRALARRVLEAMVQTP